jgi:hypothetical protein
LIKKYFMKYIIFIGIALSVVAFTNSRVLQSNNLLANTSDTSKSALKTTRQNKKQPIFDYPEFVTTNTARDSFMNEFNKGIIIYKQTCAKCHNVKKDGKLYYPDFSLPQLMDYEMRFQYPAHQDELRETNLSPAELDWVVTFLRFKKLNLPLPAK